MKIDDIITKNDLGEPYDRLSEFLELDDIIKLEQEFGGRSVRFRRGCKDVAVEYPELTLILGSEKAGIIIKVLGDICVYFPTLKRNALDKIKLLINADFNGYNYYQLAKKYGYTERHIRRILSGHGKTTELDERQMSIFELV